MVVEVVLVEQALDAVIVVVADVFVLVVEWEAHHGRLMHQFGEHEGFGHDVGSDPSGGRRGPREDQRSRGGIGTLDFNRRLRQELQATLGSW